ncbi:conserved hypothetical protein [Methylocella tundrae]|uniref:Uncharacterized protein n=1 Tax=Methylocella tundrae TaxID=227605 RepID=A0A8B6M8F0_METTU|nr:conserved hypothetical protein [Methylocella tundrae]VTZ50522.1 conserved hypothetical protein [Methylocella tundrae]
MFGVIDPAWKYEVVGRVTSGRETCQNAAAAWLKELKLSGPAGFLLDDDRARTHPAATYKVADLDLDKVTSAQFAHVEGLKDARSLAPLPNP